MDFVKEVQRRPRVMKAGDLVVIYERHDSLDHLYLKHGMIFQNKFGAFHHNDMIGKPFGSKIASRSSPGWIYVLTPTPELWSIAVHTRTQIVNELDSSVVTLLLDIHPGCKVVESGTGSGCMTLSLARAVAPNGHVYTFEYNAVRAAKAVDEFRRLQVNHLVTVQRRDVCGKVDTEDGGFGNLVGEGEADAIFLDLPEPWLALDEAKRLLKPGRSICCYSPCIDQVTKGCDKLRALGFHSIRMLEVRQRPYDGRVIEMETLGMGLSEEEERRAATSQGDPDCINQKWEVEDPQAKRARVSEEVLTKRERNRPKSSVCGSYTSCMARPIFTMKGHTAFLTFAVRPYDPAPAPASL
eukprot:gene10161-11245_t